MELDGSEAMSKLTEVVTSMMQTHGKLSKKLRVMLLEGHLAQDNLQARSALS